MQVKVEEGVDGTWIQVHGPVGLPGAGTPKSSSLPSTLVG